MPQQYSAEFRFRAIELVEQGRSVASVAKDLGIAQATLYRWWHQAQIDQGVKPGATSEESVRLRDALARVKVLEEELRATKLAAQLLEDQSVVPKGDTRW